MQRLQTDAANLHAGEQTYVIKPIAYNGEGKEMFSFDLIGIDGGGKQYNTDDIIKRKQNEMLTVYLADVLKLGQDGSGSFALSDSKTSHLELAIQYHLDVIKRVIEFDLIPQTLALNGWSLDEEDMPYLDYGDISETDLDALSKFVQRTVSVGAMSTGKGLDQSLRGSANLPEAVYTDDDVVPEEFTNASSRSGDGMETAGDGTSDDSSSDANTDNMET